MVASPPWLTSLLPVLAVLLAILLVVTTVLAIRQLRAAPAGPQPAGPTPAGPAPPRETAIGVLRRAAARLAALRDSHGTIDSIPLLVAIGASSADVQRLVPELRDGDLARAQKDLFQGDIRISVSHDGAIVSFDDGLLPDAEHCAARWMALLEGLMTAREDRPFDGLVIMLEAGQLCGPGRLPDDQLTAAAEQICQLIWTAQRTGGWRVPIYLLLTRCEALTGFPATFKALAKSPMQLQEAPLGWAVPYEPATMFERHWIRDGVESLVARLSALQSRLLARSTDTRTAEQILLFPHAVEMLEKPLSLLLAPMLRPSAYYETFMFRGFYLTGRVENDGGPELNAFARNLFRDRIFPEHLLAQPAYGATLRRQRHIRIAQVALAALLVFACIGIAVIRSRREAIASLRPSFDTITSIANQLRPEPSTSWWRTDTQPAERRLTAEDTRILLLELSRANADRTETVWAPLSFLTGADATLREAIREAYGNGIFREVRRGLSGGSAALLSASDATATVTCDAKGGSADDVDRMQQIVQRLQAYPEQVRRYRRLAVNPQIADLKSLLEFSLSVQLPDAFTTNSDLYLEAVKGAAFPQFDMPIVRANLANPIKGRFSRALAGAYQSSGIAREVSNVVAASSGADRVTPAAGQADRLLRLNAALRQLGAQVTLPENAWLATGQSTPAIAGILDSLKALATPPSDTYTAPVSQDLVNELSAAASRCAPEARDRLRNASVFGDTRILALDVGSLQLSPSMQAVSQTLNTFLALPLMTATTTPAATDFASLAAGGLPLVWSQTDLQDLQQVSESYLVFAAGALAEVPALFRTQLSAAAGEQLTRLLSSAVQRSMQRSGTRTFATRASGTTALRDEIGRFQEIGPVLLNVEIALRATGQINVANRVDQLLAVQAVRLLRQVDAILAAADPYQLADRSLSFWSGGPPLAAPAFGAATLPDLVGTLPARRDYVETLARDYAAPMTGYLEQTSLLLSPGDKAIRDRWQGIIRTLDRYHASDPANALGRLEQFISADMDRIDLTNCRQVLEGAGAGNDWFAEQLGTIRTAVAKRCGGVTYSDAVQQYSDLATAFNRSLARRFPFGDATAPDADPGDVKRIFNRFGPDLAGLQTRLAAIPAYARNGAARFVEQLAAVQIALAPMLADPAPDAPLTYDVTPAFRTNAGSDPGADQVAEASLQLGQQRLSSFSAADSTAWSTGQTVTLGLRWAANAPGMPSGTGEPAPQVNGLTASYAYRGSWALLRMIAVLRPPPGVMAQLSDRRPETIGLTLGLKPNPAAAAGGDTTLTEARLFMRIGLAATIRTPGQPDKRQPVSLPDFPAAAPPAASSGAPGRPRTLK